MEQQNIPVNEDEFEPRINCEIDPNLSVFDILKRRYSMESFPGLESAISEWKKIGRNDCLERILEFATKKDWETKVVLFKRGKSQSKAFKPCQLLWLIANSFIGNLKIFSRSGEKYGSFDWLNLFCTTQSFGIARLLCLFDYFDRAADNLERADVVFSRHVFVDWPWDDNAIVKTSHVHVHSKVMEEPENAAFVDFANKNLQIHRLIPSLTQEEVLFSVSSECLCTLLFVDTLMDDESFSMSNVWRHSSYTGYLDSFKYDSSISKIIDCIAIDALTCKHFAQSVRDLKKCYIGFSSCKKENISTGKWGCGAFGGDVAHKFLQQIMVAQLCGKTLYYSSFGQEKEMQKYLEFLAKIEAKRVTFGEALSKMVAWKHGKDFFDAFKSY